MRPITVLEARAALQKAGAIPLALLTTDNNHMAEHWVKADRRMTIYWTGGHGPIDDGRELEKSEYVNIIRATNGRVVARIEE